MDIKAHKILVATSIYPNNIPLQRMAIDTWLKAGFEVVSLNSPQEVKEVKPYFPDVKFHMIERNAKKVWGKPYIYIYDFMHYLKTTNYRICGIINSDIHFKGVQKDFLDFIYKEALDCLVYGHRVDVDNIEDNTVGKLYVGVDYFFFDWKLTNIYPDEGFCMGQPAWDYWMVAVPASQNIVTKRILSKIAYHQKHKRRWNKELNHFLIDNIVINKYVKKLYPNDNMEELRRKLNKIVLQKTGIEYKS